MSQPANVQFTVPQPDAEVAHQKGTHVHPRQVWGTLMPEQQQKVFQTIVMICNSLLHHSSGDADEKEVNNDRL